MNFDVGGRRNKKQIGERETDRYRNRGETDRTVRGRGGGSTETQEGEK